MIRFIVENYCSKRDVNGNAYWLSVVTSTKTGKGLSFTTPHESNTAGLLTRRLEWEEMHSIIIDNVPLRKHAYRAKRADLHNCCMDPAVLAAVLRLEVED